MTPHLASWSPATDTTEIRSDLRGPFFERETVELHLLDLRPVVTRVVRPRRLARLLHRIRTSPAAVHLRASVDAAFWPAVMCGGLIVGVALAFATRGEVLTWSGFEPVGGPR